MTSSQSGLQFPSLSQNQSEKHRKGCPATSDPAVILLPVPHGQVFIRRGLLAFSIYHTVITVIPSTPDITDDKMHHHFSIRGKRNLIALSKTMN